MIPRMIEIIAAAIPLSCAFLKKDARKTAQEERASPPIIIKNRISRTELLEKIANLIIRDMSIQPGKYIIEKAWWYDINLAA